MQHRNAYLRYHRRVREAEIRQEVMNHIAKIFVALALLLAPPAAYAHTTLDHASPKVGSTVTIAPTELVLWFTEKLEPAFCSIEVHNAQGATVQSGKTQGDPNDRTQLRISLKPLPPGTYRVKWRVLSVDTHRAQGSFSFHVAP